LLEGQGKSLHTQFQAERRLIGETEFEPWNNRDADTLASIFKADAELANVTGLWWHDRKSIRKAHAYSLEHIFERSTLHLVRVKVKRLSDDIAGVHARMRLPGQMPVGAITTPQNRQNIFSFVVYRVPERCCCASAHNTDNVLRVETNIMDNEGRCRSVY
jgi:uncharacterized protein (TIGR02246 family)